MYVFFAYRFDDVVLGLALSRATLSKTCSFINYIFFLLDQFMYVSRYLGLNTWLGLNTQWPQLIFVVISSVIVAHRWNTSMNAWYLMKACRNDAHKACEFYLICRRFCVWNRDNDEWHPMLRCCLHLQSVIFHWKGKMTCVGVVRFLLWIKIMKPVVLNLKEDRFNVYHDKHHNYFDEFYNNLRFIPFDFHLTRFIPSYFPSYEFFMKILKS